MISNTKEPLLSILLVLAFSLLSCCCLAITPWLFSGEGWHLYKYFLRALLIAVSILILMSFVQLTVIRIRHHILKNIALILCSILFCLYLLELIIMFIPISTGGASSLCSKNWFQYHWQENELGYRDKEIAIPADNMKRNVLIVGDSYVAGHGIKNPANRFSDIIATRLKESLNVFNLGVCGIDTQEEYERMVNYPVDPDIIIMAHTPNDIKDAVSEEEALRLLGVLKTPGPGTGSSSEQNFITASSFLINFISLNYSNYQNTLSINLLRASFQSFEQFLKSDQSKSHLVSYYNNETLLNKHLAQLNMFIQYATSKEKTLIVLLFPWLSENNFDTSNEYMNVYLERYLIENNTRVINLHSILQEVDEKDRIVGRYDSHPNELVHLKIADYLVDYIGKLDKELK